MWVALLGGLLVINLAMVWLYPIDAADVFDNIDRGRITAQYGGNPFYDPPRRYAQDIFFGYVAWPDYTSAYGPLWELMAAGTSRLAGDDRLANVLAFKALGLAFYAGCLVLIAGILRQKAPARALQGVCLFALNPFVVYETAGNGHNDIVMVFFILLGLWALVRGRYSWAALALIAGGLIKFIPLLLLPVAVAVSLRALPDWRVRLRYVLVTGLSAVVIAVAAFAPFWRGGDILAVQRRGTLFTTSVPALVQAQLEAGLGVDASQRMVTAPAALLTAAAVGYQAWRAWRTPAGRADWLTPVRAATHILLFYLLFTCLWFQPWYTLWPLALAALLPEGAVARTVVLLSYAAAWKTIIFDDFVYTGGPLPSKAWRESLLGPITLGVAWLYVAYRISLGWCRRLNRRATVA
jgi:alpha-1,6-mannosyltransferase